MGKLKGGCMCGAVTYDSSAAPAMTAVLVEVAEKAEMGVDNSVTKSTNAEACSREG